MAISLDSLIKGVKLAPPRILIYGNAGLGKTTFAAESPKPIFIATEDGFGRLGVDRWLINSWSDYKDCIHVLLTQKHEYETVVIDTIDKLETIIWKKVAEDNSKDFIEEIGYAKGYVFAIRYWQEVLADLDKLREKRGMACILNCHSLIKVFSPPEPHLEPYDEYKLALHEKAAGPIRDWLDFLLFMNIKVFPKKIEGDKTKIKPIGESERFIYTQGRPSHWAKSRWNLPYEIPAPEGKAWSNFFAEFQKAVKSNEPKSKS